MAKMKAHPYADLFPMMTAAEMEALAADIAENGLRQPIVRYQGSILDGRNRYLGCEKAGIDPTYTDFEGDEVAALALVISLNDHRRDMTATQRAIVAAKATNAARGRPTRNGTEGTVFTTERAAEVFKVGVRQVKQAKALLADAPDLVVQVEACALSLDAAYEELKGRREEAEQRAKDAEVAAALVPEFREALDAGTATLEEVIAEGTRRRREEEERRKARFEGRQIWADGLSNVVRWAKMSISTLPDESLLQYAERVPGDPPITPLPTIDELDDAIVKLQRLRSVIYGETGNGKAKGRSAAAR